MMVMLLNMIMMMMMVWIDRTLSLSPADLVNIYDDDYDHHPNHPHPHHFYDDDDRLARWASGLVEIYQRSFHRWMKLRCFSRKLGFLKGLEIKLEIGNITFIFPETTPLSDLFREKRIKNLFRFDKSHRASVTCSAAYILGKSWISSIKRNWGVIFMTN